MCPALALQPRKVFPRFDPSQITTLSLLKVTGSGRLYLATTDSAQRLVVKEYVKDQVQGGIPHILRSIDCIESAAVWQSKASLFVASPFVEGMEFFDILRAIGILSTEDSQFYLCSILLALEELKSRSVIHRDLKPENLVLTREGRLRLVGWSCAKRARRTSTVVGTPHYMAPEIILGKEYSWTADLWSAGVILFEMMCGYVPFGEEFSEPTQIFEAVMKRELIVPQEMSDHRARRVMHALLSRNHEARFGGSFTAIWQDEWIQEAAPALIRAGQKKPPPFDGYTWESKSAAVPAFKELIQTCRDPTFPDFNVDDTESL